VQARHQKNREEERWELPLADCVKARKVKHVSSFDRIAQRQSSGIARWKGDYS